jgi:mannitol/fructose-specific phosphotransferase system IIA component
MNSSIILRKENIRLGLAAMTRDEAIEMAGRMLVESGFVAEAYVDAMYAREDIVSTFIGNGVAIPHGVGTAKQHIHASGIVVLQFPEGIDYNGNTCYLVIGISGKDNEHIQILANIAGILSDDDAAQALWTTTDVDYVHALFTDGADQ